MRIQAKLIFDFIPETQRTNIEPSEMVRVVRTIYCGRMTAQGLCTEDCENCKARLIKAFVIENAIKPGALLTWQMKNAVAQAQEDAQAERKYEEKIGIFGNVLPTSESPLADLLAKYL